MIHGSLFNGIGGFQIAAEWAGWENIMSCEIDKFCNKVTKYWFPKCIQHEDIRTTYFTIYKGKIDVLTGGFPCQPYSVAGKRKGKEDGRHLWPEMLRAIQEIQPAWVVGENVFGLVNWNGGLVFEEVQSDLEAAGYEVQPFILPAAGLNAPHKRYMVWFVAYSTGERLEGGPRTSIQSKSDGFTRGYSKGIITDANGQRCQELHTPQISNKPEGQFNKEVFGCGFEDWENFPTQSPVCSRDDGFPAELDGITFSKWRNESIKAYGNAIVPQVVLQIFKAIEAY